MMKFIKNKQNQNKTKNNENNEKQIYDIKKEEYVSNMIDYFNKESNEIKKIEKEKCEEKINIEKENVEIIKVEVLEVIDIKKQDSLYSNISININNISSEISEISLTKQIIDNYGDKNIIENELKCNLCNKNNNDNFIILNCNHTIHIKCIALEQHNLILNEIENKINCSICNQKLEYEDVLLIHIKYNRKIKNIILDKEEEINKLEIQLNNIKDELKTCNYYKDKIKIKSNKSQNIINIINNQIK